MTNEQEPELTATQAQQARLIARQEIAQMLDDLRTDFYLTGTEAAERAGDHVDRVLERVKARMQGEQIDG